MGCGASKVYPERIELPLGNSSWKSASVTRLSKDSYQVRVDASDQSAEAQLLSCQLEVGATLEIRLGGQVVAGRVGRHVEYTRGTQLLVLASAELADATVTGRVGRTGSRRRLTLVDGSTIELDLNPYNHAVARFKSADAFRQARKQYVDEQLEELGLVDDAITGNRLRIEEQLIYIGTDARKEAAGKGITGVQRADWSDAGDMQTLAQLLAAPSPARSQGTHEAQGVLLLAGPGTGKSWSTQQLACLLLQKARASSEALPSLPLLVRVQHMLAVLSRAGVDVAAAQGKDGPSLLEHYIKAAFKDLVRDALLQAHDLRSLVVILDGADEAAALRTPIENLVLQSLEPTRVVLSSRPQELNGVDASRFQHFVIMNLKPLSEEQQREAIRHQLKDAKQFEHLTAFKEIRLEHDRIFTEVAFPDEAERLEIENFAQPNLFFVDGNPALRNSEMRQRRRDGSSFVRVSKAASPESASLRRLCGFFSDGLLDELDKVLAALGTNDEAKVKEAVAGLQSSPDAQRLRATYGPHFFDHEDEDEALKQDAAFKDLKLTTKLGLLLLKRREKEPTLTAAALWERIWRRTDDVFVATEDLKPIFEATVRQLAAELGIEEQDLKFGPLKDPVRIHEKALDDYARDFKDWDDDFVIPEACVVDVLRVRIVVRSGKQMLKLQRLMRGGFKMTLKDLETLLELIRAKNKLSTTVAEEKGLAGLDPTHFRNILNNVQLIHDGRVTFAEVQVHHAAILTYNDESHAHDHYNFFRAKLADSYGRELDAMLERAILFFDEVSGNPVLLSMLALIFSGGSDSKSLPASLLQLYSIAMRAAVQRRLAPAGESGQEQQSSSIGSNLEVELVLRMLSRVAVASQLSGKENVREFTGSLVEEAISEEELVMWNSMLDEPRGLPLVKQIEAADGGASSFQFTHLSFQEGMFAQALADGSAAGSLKQRRGGARSLLANPTFTQALRIGGSEIAAALGLVGDKGELVVIDKVPLSTRFSGWSTITLEELDAMIQLQWAPLGSSRKALTLRLPRDIDDAKRVAAWQQLAEYIRSNASLSHLE